MNKKTTQKKEEDLLNPQPKTKFIDAFKKTARSSARKMADNLRSLPKLKLSNLVEKEEVPLPQKTGSWLSRSRFGLGRKSNPTEQTKEGQAKDGKKSGSGSFFLRMSAQEQIIFAKRLAILIKAGVPITTALDMLAKQSDSKSARKIITDLLTHVERGQSLGKAMESHRNVFGNFAINIVSIGELSGTLTENLQYLADELKKKWELRRNIISALIYPGFIMAATTSILIMLTVYVFPKILPIFSSFKATLPWSTKTLIAFSSAMQHYWAYMLIGLFVFATATFLLTRIYYIRLFADRFFFRLPLFGPMFKSYHIANFSRTLGLLLKSEIGIMQALEIVGDTSGSAAYNSAFRRVAEGVARGESISENMAKEKLLFPPLVSQMAGVGEMTGNLSSSFMYLSEMYEDEMNNLTKNLSTSIEPVLMIVMGISVGFIAISIITPIYGITQSLHP